MTNKLFSISGAIREGWELFKVNFGFLIIYQIILFGLLWLFSDAKKDWKLEAIHLVGWFVIILSKMGFYNSALLLTKGLKPSFDQFYSNWRLFLSWIVAGFLFGIMIMLGLFLLIIPGIMVWVVFGFYPFFILDKGSGPIEALQQSAEATKGIRWHLFLLFLSCAALDFLGVLCFGVGLLIASPVTLIAVASVYRKITGQAKTSIQPDDILPKNE